MSQSRRTRRAAERANKTVAAPREPQSAPPRELLWISLGLIVSVVITYWPVQKLGFVRFDDPTYVTENPHVATGLTWSAVRWAFTSGYGANWHPITWLSHMLDIQLYGFEAGAHHITSLLVHSATTVLLFGALFRMTGAVWRSAVVAALFGLHPIHVESVAWVAERKDVLSAFFWMLTLLAYASYVRERRSSSYAWVVVAFALGLMSKPMVVTLPFVLLLLDLWPLRRIEVPVRWTAARALVLEKTPLFAMSVASSVITFLAQRQGGTVASGVRLPLGERLGNAVTAYVSYIGKAVWPIHLAAYYPYPRVLPTAWVLVCTLFLLAASAGAIVAARARPFVLVGWLWYLGTLVPAIGIVQVGTQAMADRYTYIPLIGIFIVVAWGVADLLSRWPRWRVPTAVFAVAALLLFATTARVQVRYWESSMTLWKHALAVTTDNYAAHTYYGNALLSRGDINAAIAEYVEAIRIQPDYPEAHNNLGPALASEGKIDDAIKHFNVAIRLRPNYADAHSNLGVALASQGKIDQAIAEYIEALRLDPDHARARGNLGLALKAQGRTADAMRELELALRANPDNADVRNALAVLQSTRRTP